MDGQMICTDGWMDGWVDGFSDALMHGLMGGQTGRWVETCVGGRMIECGVCRGRLQAATAAAQYSEQQQASAVAAGQQAQQAAAQVGATHKAASKAKAEVSKLATQASRLKEVGRLEEAKNAQSQAKRSTSRLLPCVSVCNMRLLPDTGVRGGRDSRPACFVLVSSKHVSHKKLCILITYES